MFEVVIFAQLSVEIVVVVVAGVRRTDLDTWSFWDIDSNLLRQALGLDILTLLVKSVWKKTKLNDSKFE